MFKKSVQFSSSVQVIDDSASSPGLRVVVSQPEMSPKRAAQKELLYKRAKECYCYSHELPEPSPTERTWIERCYDAVLEEQIEQWASGERDPEKMASVYRKFSHWSQVKAIAGGRRTRFEAWATTSTY
eukprot:scaffold2082_cov85-Cylindrotheca_fusiformis.AAC.3